MRDTDKKALDSGKARGSRVPPVIELSAADITPATSMKEAPAPETPSPVETVVTETKDKETEALKPQAEKASDEPKETIVSSKQVERDKDRKPSRVLPLALAALIGGLAGTIGGSALPGLLGLGATAPSADLQKLRQQISAIDVKPATAELDALRQKVQALEGELAKRVTDAETRLSGRITGAENEMNELAARPAGSPAATVDLSPLTQRLGAIENELKALDGKTEAGAKAVDPKIAAIAQQVDQATRRMTAANAAPFFSAVQGLAQAFHSGQPFVTELTAVELLGGQAEQLAPLKAIAGKGAPTVQQLTSSLAPLAGKLAQTEDKSESWGWALVQRFAKVRSTGQVGGATPPDLVTTMEAALAKGDVQAALTAWRRLPDANRAVANDWAAAAEGRDKAAKAVATIQDSAISALRTARP